MLFNFKSTQNVKQKIFDNLNHQIECAVFADECYVHLEIHSAYFMEYVRSIMMLTSINHYAITNVFQGRNDEYISFILVLNGKEYYKDDKHTDNN